MSQLTSTQQKIKFLEEHMYRQFCLKWASFTTNIDRFGKDVILGDYAAAFAGRGYVASQIKHAIEQALKGKYCPDPKSLQQMVESLARVEREIENPKVNNRQYTQQERARHRATMKILLQKTPDIIDVIRETGPDLRKNPQNARNLVTSYIDTLTETIAEGQI
ncbi:hypothetical protein Q4575_05440 [Psychrosphaera sp. 1_MG-2023]|uniref:hypothetical protein n=1 Tax=Psychrosphaera sp. 1_MG-2023 TaxID=3062643 RepID=UPI0026E36BDD|nr:hypothetical protein [Psychrosphaera sp. 1_MG-2023]MDO6718834.1 hypothetical protein [Psychrosphaera sp. 1_MG-2023]